MKVFYVYGQLQLQVLWIVMDVVFWIFTFFLVELLSIISNPETQIASVLTSISGGFRMLSMETRRAKVLATYGSKVLNLIISNNIYPTYEPTFAPIKDALRIHPGDKSNTSLYIPSDFNISNHWEPSTIFYNPDGNYSLADKWENNNFFSKDIMVDYEDSKYIDGTTIFNKSDSSSGNFFSCGLTDKWSSVILGVNGAYNHYINLPVVPILPQVMCINKTSNLNNSEFIVPSDYLDPYFGSNPGDNFTLFGIDKTAGKIFAGSVSYYNFRYGYNYLSNEPGFSSDPLSFLNSTFNSFDLDLSSPNYNILFNKNNNDTTLTYMRNITKSLLKFIDLYYNSDASFVLTFTLGKKLEGNISSYGVLHNKVTLGYYREADALAVTQNVFTTRNFIFEYDYNNQNTNTPNYYSNLIEQWGVSLIPVASNIKVSTFVYTVLSETLGITVKGYGELGFYYPGKVRYNATAIAIAIASATLASLVLFFITKVILYKYPQGIPTYYGLLHEYHKNCLDASPPYDAEIERQSIFKIIDKAYEGAGYDGKLQRNRVGILDEASIRVGTNKNGIIKRRFIR
ncbi:uncharacterized protein SAPINGB_P002369 [Magnusiomyces paraingens]|uniref:Uncharacterized protein n=1 Tax=Magnusiomyces paraingens TaxID=2606893 RepID=A0A5E8BDU6_9ASCO|nr:uncharacterized protein SAPINGB_P002369 [Saprochaete ingens]VVT49639.1 unnamed protein product [Saprochaete ingens]